MDTTNTTNERNMPAQTQVPLSQQKHSASGKVAPIRVFQSNQPQAAYQRKIAALMNNTPHAKSISQLQEKVNNSARMAVFNEKPFLADNAPAQLAPEEDELLQGKFAAQLAPEEDELMQGKFTAQLAPEEDELMQGKFAVQRAPEEDELLQGKFSGQNTKQLKTGNKPRAQRSSASGIPDSVTTNMETATGHDFSNVQFHKNSASAVDVGALSYAQGNDIHFAPGQFSPNSSAGKSLIGHELTHVAQQREGRVQPTIEVSGMPVNDNPSLEKEADNIGGNAAK